MAWSYHGSKSGSKKDAWSIEEPASKRRKRQEEEQTDDWGDDSLELTQAEIESIDVMASQVLNASQMPEQSTSAASFVRPNNPLKLSTNKSSSSSDSSLRPKSFSSLSSISSDTSSSSLSSHASISNGAVPKKQEDTKLEKGTDFEAELEKKNEQIQNALSQKNRSDGEVKYLRQKLQKKETEMENLQSQKNAVDDQQKQIHLEKVRQLQLQVDKLMSEAQFKEREYQEMISTLDKKLKKVDESQKQQSTSDSSAASSHETKTVRTVSPVKLVVKPSPPRKQRKTDEALSGSQLHHFPTQSSFMEKPVGQSPTSKTSPVSKGTKSVSCQAHTDESGDKVHPKRVKMRRLQLERARDVKCGTDILSEMIQPCGTSSNEGEPGLPGLLHAMSTSVTMDNLSYSRNRDNSFLSPLKPKRYSQLPRSELSMSGDSSYMQVVSPDNFHLAVQGLDMLLQSTQHTSGLRENIAQSFINRRDVSQIPSALNKAVKSDVSDAETSQDSLMRELLTSKDQSDCGAILLLPMLCDYLHHYQEMIHSVVSKGVVKSPGTTPVSNTIQPGSSSGLDSFSLHTGSSSYDSSLDSLSSCVIHLLQEGKMYAMSVEKYTVSALQCLSLLIQMCPAVISTLAHPCLMESGRVVEPSTSTKHMDERESPNKKAESGTDADDEKSTSSSEVRIISGHNKTSQSFTTSSTPHSLHNQSRLLQLVARLAGENLEEGNAGPVVVEEALGVLNHLCRNSSEEELLCLQSVIGKDALSLALRQMKYPHVLRQAQQLCGLLIHHPDLIAQLCTKSENCPLYNMYRLCEDPQVGKLHPVSLQLYSEHVNILSSLISHQRTRLSGLLINSCVCSEELVVSTILALYKLFMAHSKQSSITDHPVWYTLLQGVLVLHCLALADGAFLRHHIPVQLPYVRLLTGLSKVIKPIRSQWEWYATVLDELCDFEPEIHESSSQDSENDDRMDLS